MGGWGIPFLISTSPSEGRRWSGGPAWISGRAPTGSLPLRCCRPRRLPSAGPPGGRDSIVGLPSKLAVRLQVAWRGGCQAASPHGGRKAIMSRDRHGLWELQEQRSRAFSCGWGPGGGGRCPLHAPRCSLALRTRQEEHLGVASPAPQPRALPGLPSSWPYLPLDPGLALAPWRTGAGIVPSLCLGRSGSSLSCYTSRTETVLGPMDSGQGGDGGGVSSMYGEGGWGL